MAKIEKLKVHGKDMEIYPASPELIAAYQAARDSEEGSEDWEEKWGAFSQLVNAIGPGTHDGYVLVGDGMKVEKEQTPGVSNRVLNLMSLEPVDIDKKKFSKDMEDEETDSEVERQVGAGVLQTMLIVHQFQSAKKEVGGKKDEVIQENKVTLEYVPAEKTGVLVFYDQGIYLIASGIGRTEGGKKTDLAMLAEGETELNLYASGREVMEHAVVHAFRLPHKSGELPSPMPR